MFLYIIFLKFDETLAQNKYWTSCNNKKIVKIILAIFTRFSSILIFYCFSFVWNFFLSFVKFNKTVLKTLFMWLIIVIITILTVLCVYLMFLFLHCFFFLVLNAKTYVCYALFSESSTLAINSFWITCSNNNNSKRCFWHFYTSLVFFVFHCYFFVLKVAACVYALFSEVLTIFEWLIIIIFNVVFDSFTLFFSVFCFSLFFFCFKNCNLCSLS